MLEITTPVGRLVSGHPMVSHPVTDDKTGLPKMQRDNITPQVSFYFGLAIQKGAEQHWNQTEWGAKIWNEALAAWPNGETQQPTFSWKISDGDSTIPNKKMKKPCDREGYPGHWVLHVSNGFPIKCFNRGNYEPTQQIQQKEMIKPGDYCRAVFTVTSNNSKQTAGMYLNPALFEMYQAGIEIQTESSVDASSTLGATVAQLPAGAMVDPNVPAMQQQPIQQQPAPPMQQQPAPPIQQQQPAPPIQQQQQQQPGMAPIAPATDLLTPPPAAPMRVLQGVAYTVEALRLAGYTPEAIAALPQQ